MAEDLKVVVSDTSFRYQDAESYVLGEGRQFERIRPANLQLQTETLLRRRALQAQPRLEDGSVYRQVWWS